MRQQPFLSIPSAARGLPVPMTREIEAEQHYRKGVRALQDGHWAEAARHFNRATRTRPGEVLYWINLAQAHRKQNDIASAEAAIRQAIALDPANLLACKFGGTLLAESNRLADAVAVYGALAPSAVTDHDYHCAYGEALYKLERYSDAIHQFMLSFTCKPSHVQAHLRMSSALARIQMHEQAAECMRTVMALDPDSVMARSQLIMQNQYACRWETQAEDERELAARLASTDSPDVPPFNMLVHECTPQDQLRVARFTAAREFGPTRPLPGKAHLSGGPDDRLRIGYLSADFHQHATPMLLAEVLERHDRERVEVFLYSHGLDDGSHWRQRVKASSEHWVDALEMSDLELARRMRADGIDILVDLKGFTRDTRMQVLAHRPAPIQATWLGFPATCGAPFVDYIIGDPVVTPRGAQGDFSEQIAQMPWSYQPNDRQRAIGPRGPRELYGLPPEGFVFCSFNVNYKIVPTVFDRWCRLLQAVPGSVLWLFESNPQASTNLIREIERRGIDRSRLVFAPWAAPALHLARAQLADLFLDTLPCNAHTTASDALWAGLPVLTCQGQTFASRVASSLLRAVDCPELITHSLDEYEALALALARDPARLGAIRQRLADRRMSAPLFDSERFARDLEALYRRMAQRHRDGLPPGPLWADDPLA
jgi:predicted O-linked N-acetylglucosamine transferase (SPINDLY family)